MNGRQLFVRVDCNLEDSEHVLLVQEMHIIHFMADTVISAEY